MAELHNCGQTTICVEGDDGIMTFQFPENAPTEEDFKKNGLIIKLIESDNLADLSFCGQVFDPDDGIVLTEPFDALVNAGYSRKLYVKAGNNLKLQLLRARALSMLYQYNGCPMLSAFAVRVIYLTRNIRVRSTVVSNLEQYKRDIMREALNLHIDPIITSSTAPCRALFARLYGVSISDQLIFEDAMSSLELYSEIDVSAILDYPKQNVWMFDYKLYQGLDPGLSLVDEYYLMYLNKFATIPWPFQLRRFLAKRNQRWCL